jgi:2-keto-myo-inositol isomerase
MKREQLAINSVSTQQRGLDEALDAYAAAGFRNVEFVLPLVKEWVAHDHSIDDARRLLAAHDMRAIGGFETHLACLAPPEPRRANHDLLRANAQLIHDLGGGTMVVGTDGPSQPLPDPLAALDTIADVFGVFMRAIEDVDVTVALEFNWSPVVKSLQSA